MRVGFCAKAGVHRGYSRSVVCRVERQECIGAQPLQGVCINQHIAQSSGLPMERLMGTRVPGYPG